MKWFATFSEMPPCTDTDDKYNFVATDMTRDGTPTTEQRKAALRLAVERKIAASKPGDWAACEQEGLDDRGRYLFKIFAWVYQKEQIAAENTSARAK